MVVAIIGVSIGFESAAPREYLTIITTAGKVRNVLVGLTPKFRYGLMSSLESQWMIGYRVGEIGIRHHYDTFLMKM